MQGWAKVINAMKFQYNIIMHGLGGGGGGEIPWMIENCGKQLSMKIVRNCIVHVCMYIIGKSFRLSDYSATLSIFWLIKLQYVSALEHSV